jgi:hypothetical protein
MSDYILVHFLYISMVRSVITVVSPLARLDAKSDYSLVHLM